MLVVPIQRVLVQKHDDACVFCDVSCGVYVCVWFLIHRDCAYVFCVYVSSSVFFFHNHPKDLEHNIDNTLYDIHMTIIQ